jgi:hypothetical protein
MPCQCNALNVKKPNEESNGAALAKLETGNPRQVVTRTSIGLFRLIENHVGRDSFPSLELRAQHQIRQNYKQMRPFSRPASSRSTTTGAYSPEDELL